MLKKGKEGDATLRTYMLLKSYNNLRRYYLYKNKHLEAFPRNLTRAKRALSYYTFRILQSLI